MKVKHIILIGILALSFNLFSSKDSVTIFTSYQNYINKIGETYDKMVNYYGTEKMKITVSKNDVETNIKCKEIWGFLYNGHLFRTDKKSGEVGELIVNGKICYYENGIAHLEMIRSGTNHENFTMGHHCFVSKDLSSKLTPMPSLINNTNSTLKQFRKFKKANPIYTDLFKAINEDFVYQNIRAKVIVFNRNFIEAK